jgi:hypothetical protein
MPPEPTQAQRLRTFDDCRRAFVEDCAARAQCGARLGGQDVRTLDELASEIVGGVMAWGAIFERLDLARDASSRYPASFEPRRASALVAECVFDELLTPSAWRLLSASLDLADVG